MGIQEAQIPKHWNYLLSLEEDVTRLSRYLELTQENFDCYSLELARILFAAASEVDVVAKQVCQTLDPSSKANNINAYRKEIRVAHPWIADIQVSAPRFGLTFQPWEQWSQDKNPLWWRAYNNVKHQRHTHFSEASLKHTLNAVTALFLLVLVLYRQEGANGQLAPSPSVLKVGAPIAVDHMFYAPGNVIYAVPEAVTNKPAATGDRG